MTDLDLSQDNELFLYKNARLLHPFIIIISGVGVVHSYIFTITFVAMSVGYSLCYAVYQFVSTYQTTILECFILIIVLVKTK